MTRLDKLLKHMLRAGVLSPDDALDLKVAAIADTNVAVGVTFAVTLAFVVCVGAIVGAATWLL